MSKISKDDLQEADILVTKGHTIAARAIQFATRSNFSHAVLYIGNRHGENSVIESVSQGVVINRLDTVLSYADMIMVYRHKQIGNNGQRVSAFALQQAERQIKYDLLGALETVLPISSFGKAACGLAAVAPIAPLGLIKAVAGATCGLIGKAAVQNSLAPDGRFFCSELIARAFQTAGLFLCSNSPTQTKPSDIPVSLFLDCVGQLK